MPDQEERICFVIAPIGEEGTEVRRRSDQVLKHIITPAAKECGYKAVRADTISEPGMITSQVIQHLVEDPLVIADLTGRNPNVFYELAVRHAVRKPCVQIIQMGEPIPFDVSQSRTIQVDHHDLDSAARCKEELVRQIHSVEKDPSDIDTPITVAIDLQSLRQSDNPLEKSNAEIISILQDLVQRIDKIPFIYQPIIAHQLLDMIFKNVYTLKSDLEVLIGEIAKGNSIDQDQLNIVINRLNHLELMLDNIAGGLGYSHDTLMEYKEKVTPKVKRKALF
ncbi:MAG: hypothetical protein M0P73_08545 [Syntrophobacterales bacterium]|jgi:hypothetical protein|nr:hypothetical protein [Syntrophobacterales bacterium]